MARRGSARSALVAFAANALFLLTACGGGGGSTSPSTASPEGSVTALSIDSSNTGITYPLTIYVPAGASQALPVIYALDAETRFTKLMEVVQASGNKAILVGVANTGDARRQVDFLMPGAIPYYRFVAEELMPLIEARYPADPARRILSGHSSSALFVGYALFNETPANHRFSAFICADGSFWQQPVEVAQAESAMFAADSGHPLPLAIVMGGDIQGNYVYVDQVYNLLLGRGYPGIRLEERTYAIGHVPMDAPFFRDALAIIFGG